MEVCFLVYKAEKDNPAQLDLNEQTVLAYQQN